MKEVRYNPPRPADDPRDGPATYRHRGLGLVVTSDRWTPVDDAAAEALVAVPGMEMREAGDETAVHAEETPEAAATIDAPGGSTPAPEAWPEEDPEPAGAGPQAMTAGRRGRRRGGADG